MNEYPLSWIRTAADQLYHRKVSDRAFRNWLRICKIQPWSRTVNKTQALHLLTMAYLKGQNPKASIGWVRLRQHLKSAPIPEEWLEIQVKQAMFATAKGRDLPQLIRQVTGRRVSIRTLYRWSKKYRLTFGVNEPIPKAELLQWFKIAS